MGEPITPAPGTPATPAQTPPVTPAQPPAPATPPAASGTPQTPAVPPQLAKFTDAATGKLNVPNLAKSLEALQASMGQAISTHSFIGANGTIDSAALGNAYVALEAQRGKESGNLQIPAPEAVAPTDGFRDVLRKAGIPEEAIYREWKAEGSLTEGMYEKIAKGNKAMTKGIVNDIVGMGVATFDAKRAQALSAATQVAGGEQQMSTLLQWASSLPPADVARLNGHLNDPNMTVAAMHELNARYATATGGQEGALLTGNPPAQPNAGGGFKTQDEAMTAMDDPKYKSDKAYRTQVDKRIGQTSDAVIMGG